MKSIVAVLFVISIGFAGIASAEPQIQAVAGAIPNGSNVTISGFDFLQKAPAAPLRYFNFENGENGVRLPDQSSGGWYTVGMNGSYPRYSQDRQRIPGEVCALQDYSDASNQTIGLRDIDVDTLYVSGWTYRDDYNGTAMYCQNVKFWGNFTARDNGTSTFPQNRLDTYWSGGSGHLYCLDENGQSMANIGTGTREYLDEWFRLERYMAIGDPSGDNGITWASYNLDRFAELNGTFYNGGSAYEYWLIGQYFRKEPFNDPDLPEPHVRVYWSELYVDNTLARVEIGDQQDWDACTHREIQIPVAWQDGQITITGNWGTFAAGSQVYLFVVDRTGQHSVGFSATLGAGSGDLGPPGQVSSLIMYQ